LIDDQLEEKKRLPEEDKRFFYKKALKDMIMPCKLKSRSICMVSNVGATYAEQSAG
jgi:hypothetical protein